MGFSPKAIAAFLAEQRGGIVEDEFLVHPHNIKAVRLFRGLLTQWRTAGLSTMSEARVVRTGLDYAAITPTVLRLMGLRGFDEGDFLRLRSMEIEAISAWSESNR